MKSMPITTNPPGGRFAEGGKTKMFGWRGTGEQTPGQSAEEGTGPRRDQKAKAGPAGVASSNNSKGVTANNRDYAGTQASGTGAATKTGGDSKFAQGGKTAMFGNRGSQRATPGSSSPV